MILPILMVAFAMTGQSAQSMECGNLITRTTDTWFDSGARRTTLTVHTEDDHSKNSHQCMSQYTLKIVRPDGTSTDNQMYSVIADWGRPIKFWINGIVSDHRLIATTIEGESWQLLVYDLNAPDHAPSVYDLSKNFLPRLSASCRDSLGVVGLTRAGDPVIAGNDLACREARGRRWKVEQHGEEQHARAVPLPEHDAFLMLAPRRPPSL